MIDWNAIKNEYILSGGKALLKDLAAKYGVKDSTLRSRKNREKWDDEFEGCVATPKCNVADETQHKSCKNEKVSIEVIENLDKSGLTNKQKLFCIYYVKYFNATKAAIKAGYSKESAYNIGYENMNKRDVQAEIERLKANKLIGAYLSKEDLLQKYIDIAFADITDYVEFGRKDITIGEKEDGTPETIEVNYVDFKNSSEVDGTIISEVSQGKNGVSVKLQDKMKALDFLAKNIGLLDIATQQKLEIEQRKMALLEKQSDDLDEDIEYVIEDDANEEEKED